MNDLLGRKTRGLTKLSMLAIAVVTFSLIWYLKGHHLGKLTSERKVECVWRARFSKNRSSVSFPLLIKYTRTLFYFKIQQLFT